MVLLSLPLAPNLTLGPGFTPLKGHVLLPLFFHSRIYYTTQHAVVLGQWDLRCFNAEQTSMQHQKCRKDSNTTFSPADCTSAMFEYYKLSHYNHTKTVAFGKTD